MNKKVIFLTQTAVMLALLIALQWITKPLGQIVTGTCVNAVLAVTCLLIGNGSAMTVALLSPIFAFLLGIAPNLIAVPAIMAGNAVFVNILQDAGKSKKLLKKVINLMLAALSKFVVLYVLMVVIVCGSLSDLLLAAGALKEPMLKVLPATFSWPQLVTALAGGALALLITPVLRKALKKTN